MINTKLATEYEKQLKAKFPNTKTIIHSMGKNICLDFTLDIDDEYGLKTDKNVWFTVYYESKDYKNDIPLKVETQYYDGVVEFVESHKVFEMNVNNLLYAVNVVYKDKLAFYYMKERIPTIFQDKLNLVNDVDLDIALDWAIKHGVCYKGAVKEFKKVSKDDYWNSDFKREELKYAIAIMKSVYSECGSGVEDDDKWVNSYGLKHRFENFMDKLNNHKYFSTGTATVAAWYVFVGDGCFDANRFDLKQEGPNFDFKLPKQAVLYFNDLTR